VTTVAASDSGAEARFLFLFLSNPMVAFSFSRTFNSVFIVVVVVVVAVAVVAVDSDSGVAEAIVAEALVDAFVATVVATVDGDKIRDVAAVAVGLGLRVF